MCQQWLSVAGLVLDVIGFLIIAFEWRHPYLHSVFLREVRVRHTQRENLKDNRYRARLFFVSLPYGIPFFGFGNCSAVAG
jgi:hypothetical protein